MYMHRLLHMYSISRVLTFALVEHRVTRRLFHSPLLKVRVYSLKSSAGKTETAAHHVPLMRLKPKALSLLKATNANLTRNETHIVYVL